MNYRYLFKFFIGLGTTFVVCLASAQTAGVLYDPEPPVDSAYVRLIIPAKSGVFDISIDGRARIKKLSAGDASEYMVLTAGTHSLAIQPTGKSTTLLSANFEVVKGRSVTLAFPELKVGAAAIVFEDKANTNKLKSLLSVYLLDSKVGLLDVLTADGSTKVFTNVAYGTSASLLVNPISIDLIVTATGQKSANAKSSLLMTQGNSYSIFLLPTESGKVVAKTSQSKTERYTGK